MCSCKTCGILAKNILIDKRHRDIPRVGRHAHWHTVERAGSAAKGPGSSTDEVARYPASLLLNDAHAGVLDAIAQLGKAPRLDGSVPEVLDG
jgi:hypothetical protein